MQGLQNSDSIRNATAMREKKNNSKKDNKKRNNNHCNYIVMMTLQSGCSGVIYLNVQNLTRNFFLFSFLVSILSVKVKLVDERKTTTTKKNNKSSMLMFICKIRLKSETINNLLC